MHSEHGPEEAIAGHDDAVTHEDDLTHNDEEEEHHDDEADGGHEEAADQEQFSFAPPELGFPGKLHDNNSSKAFGGRIAYAYLPGFEAGFSYYRGAYDDTGNLDFKAEAIDLTYNRRYFTLRGEYIRTHTDALGILIDPDHIVDDDLGHLDEADHSASELTIPTTTISRDGWYGEFTG